MAWIERRGKYWRVRYERDDGTYGSLSDRYNKTTAKRLAREIDADQQRGTFLDPKRGDVSLAEFAEQWFAAHQVGPATAAQYRSLWRNHIEPEWEPGRSAT